MIGILEMLKDKTEGRRSAREEQVLDGLLYELRMAYVARAPGDRSVRAAPGALALVLAATALGAAQGRSAGEAGRGSWCAASRELADRFESVFAAYVKARQAGDVDGARRAFQEIQRLRIERNVLNLEDVALAIVAEGKRGPRQGRPGGGDGAIRRAPPAWLPHLPDAHLGLALAEMKRGLARLPARRGAHH